VLVHTVHKWQVNLFITNQHFSDNDDLYCEHTLFLRFVAFLATEYDQVLSGYQPGQMVEWWKNQRFEDHLCPHPQGTSLTNQTSTLRTTLVFSLLNHLTQLIAWENFITFWLFTNQVIWKWPSSPGSLEWCSLLGCKPVTYPYPVAPAFTFPNSHSVVVCISNCCVFFWIPSHQWNYVKLLASVLVLVALYILLLSWSSSSMLTEFSMLSPPLV